MAVHASLARCLRATPSSTLIRPMVSQSSSFSCGQLHRVCQRSGYASNGSPDTTKANEQASPSSQQASSTTKTSSDQPKPSILDNLDGDMGLARTEQEIKLKKQMAKLDSQMKDLARPSQNAGTRTFFMLPKSSRSKAEVDAEKTLGKLLAKSESIEKSSVQKSADQIDDIRSSAGAMRNVDEISPPKLRPIAMKLDTKLGRQVLVQNDRGMDCATAIRTLQINCNANGIRRQANAQKFHVRRGQLRKDLKSQRWRKLFKFSFDATVKRIQRMRNQGW